MSSVDKIKWAMSLRDPQYEALQYFDAISSKIEYRTCSKADAEKIASENCQDPHTISVDKEFDFPSFCFDMTTVFVFGISSSSRFLFLNTGLFLISSTISR